MICQNCQNEQVCKDAGIVCYLALAEVKQLELTEDHSILSNNVLGWNDEAVDELSTFCEGFPILG